MSLKREAGSSLHHSLEDVRVWKTEKELQKEALLTELEQIRAQKVVAAKAAQEAEAEVERLQDLKDRATNRLTELVDSYELKKSEVEGRFSNASAKFETAIDEQWNQTTSLTTNASEAVKVIKEEAKPLLDEILATISRIEAKKRSNESKVQETLEVQEAAMRHSKDARKIKRELEETRRKKQSVINKVGEKKQHLQSLKNEKTDVESSKDVKTATLNKIRNEREASRAHLNMQIPMKEAELKCLSNEIEEITKQQESKRGELETMKNKVDVIHQNTDNVQEDVRSKEAELQCKKELLASKEETLAEMQEKISDRITQMKEFIRQRDCDVQGKIEKANSELEQLDTDERRTQSEIQHLREKNSRHSEEKHELEQKIATLKNLLEKDKEEEMLERQTQARQEEDEERALKFQVNCSELKVLDAKEVLRAKEKTLTSFVAEVSKFERDANEINNNKRNSTVGHSGERETAFRPPKDAICAGGNEVQETTGTKTVARPNTQRSITSESDFSDFLARTSPSRFESGKLTNYSFFKSVKK